MNLIDFHIHGKGSFFKDKYANASYDDICNFFEQVAEEEDKDLVIAITEHDNISMTYEEFKQLRIKYPRVKIALGMESNAKLSYATDGMYECAHVLLYADMSSEENIKKWFDCKELKSLSKLNTFTVKYPSPLIRVKSFIEKFNFQFKTTFNEEEFAKKFEKLPQGISHEKLKILISKYLADELYRDLDKNKYNAEKFYRTLLDNPYSENFSNITYDDIYQKIDRLKFVNKKLEPKKKYIGNSLYIAKNILGKYLRLKISNNDFAMILDEAKSYEQMRNEFLKITRYKIEKHNPELFDKIKNLPLDKFANYPLGNTTKNGAIILNKFFPKNLNDSWAIDNDELRLSVRTRLSELDEIAKKTGGYLMLAHPNSRFEFGKKEYFEAQDFPCINKHILSKSKYEKLKSEIKSNGFIEFNKIVNTKNEFLKLDLFFNICKKHGITFAGFEITKNDLGKKALLVNKLIYAAKNGYEVSFGSDSHISKSKKYYDLLRRNKIDVKTFETLRKKLENEGDIIAKDKTYDKLYGENFSEMADLSGIEVISKKPTVAVLKNAKKPLYAAKNYNRVLATSLADKVFGKSTDAENRTMFEISTNNGVYTFGEKDLKEMQYLSHEEKVESKTYYPKVLKVSNLELKK